MKLSFTDLLKQLGLGFEPTCKPRVRTTGRHKVLHFGQIDIQSEMDPKHPDL